MGLRLLSIGSALAVAVGVTAGSSAALADSGAQGVASRAVEVSPVKATIGWSQAMPLPKERAAYMTLTMSFTVRLTGVKAGTEVEARYSQPSTGSESGFSTRIVEEGGLVRLGWGQSFFSVQEAEAALSNYTGPVTVEVKVTPDASPSSVTFDSVTVMPRLVMANVTMTKQGKLLVFKGRVLTSTGKPVRNAKVYAVQFRPYGSTNITTNFMPRSTNARGQFTVTAPATHKGTVGVSLDEAPNHDRMDWVFSRVFVNR